MIVFKRNVVQLYWAKSTQHQWLRLHNFSLHNIKARGIYVIWHGGETPFAVRVGQGYIAEQIAADREDPNVLAFSKLGLWVTWASADWPLLDGMQRYLAEELQPRLAERFPAVAPVAVSWPWDT